MTFSWLERDEAVGDFRYNTELMKTGSCVELQREIKKCVWGSFAFGLRLADRQ